MYVGFPLWYSNIETCNELLDCLYYYLFLYFFLVLVSYEHTLLPLPYPVLVGHILALLKNRFICPYIRRQTLVGISKTHILKEHTSSLHEEKLRKNWIDVDLVDILISQYFQ